MSRIIDDLLLLSKADTGKMQLKVEDVAVEGPDSRGLHGYEDFCRKEEHGAYGRGIDETKMKGDELKLRRMLWNIVENGIKYTQTGRKGRDFVGPRKRVCTDQRERYGRRHIGQGHKVRVR